MKPAYVFCFAILCVFAFQVPRPLCGRHTPPAQVTGSARSSFFSRRTFVDAEGRTHPYVLFVPLSPPGQKLPVLMFLNGLNENGNDGLKQISNNFGVQVWEAREYFPFIAIAPQCRAEGAWNGDAGDANWAMQILDQTVSEFDADADRLCLTGVSAGGSGAWSVASKYPDRFAAILPLCGAGAREKELAAIRMPIWNIYNEGDGANLVKASRQHRRELIKLGNSPLVSEYNSPGHDCWNRAYRTPAVFSWLLEQRRSLNEKASLFQYQSPERLSQEWVKSEGCDVRSQEDEVALVRSATASGAAYLISDVNGSSIEFHTDVWLGAETDCQIVFRSEASLDRQCRISIVRSEAGTGGVADFRGEWRARLDPAAQATLLLEAWNDVRVRLHEGRVSVRLNGLPAVDVELEPNKSSPSAEQFRCGIVAPEDGSEIRFRLIRTRIESSGVAIQEPAK